MHEDRESGAAAAAWGRHTAVRIGQALGATSTSSISNEFTFRFWAIPARTFEQHVRDGRSRGSGGKVGLVTRRVFQELGQRVGCVRI